MIESYRTLAHEHRHETARVKGSRFIASVAPAKSVDEAGTFLDRIRREFHDARHTASAWRFGPGGDTWRFDDDGEPSGSAGRPLLREIESRALTDVVVAVTRYFGGVKLGVGGLMRAYGAAAAEALDAAGVRTVHVTRRVTLRYAYDLTSAVNAALAALDATPVVSRYEEIVTQGFDVAPSRVAAFVETVTDRTGGRVEVRVEPAEEA